VNILHLGGWTLRILVGLRATTIDILESGEIFPGELENILRRGEEYFFMLGNIFRRIEDISTRSEDVSKIQ
jgi:hypothetical protein